MTQIAIFAGLGNQLFQYSFGHLSALRSNQVIGYVVDKNPQADRPFELSKLFENCNHSSDYRVADIRELRQRSTMLGISNKLHKMRLGQFFFKLPQSYEILPYQFEPNQIQIGKLNVGYFQHWKYVSEAWDTLKSEFEDTLPKVSGFWNRPYEPKECVVLHIRRGDLLQSIDSMGVLDVKYYINALECIKSDLGSFKIVGITDDLDNSRKIFEKVKPDFIFGPDQLNAWEALSLMANAAVVIAANSTFSWWGAFLSSTNGGTAFLPNPWFKNWNQPINDAFLFPGAIPQDSLFITKEKP